MGPFNPCLRTEGIWREIPFPILFFSIFFLFLFFNFYLFIFSFIFISWTLALQGILPCLCTSVPPGGAAGGNLYILIKGTGKGPSLLRLLTSFHGAHSSGRRIGFFQFPTQTGALPHRLCCFPKLSKCGGGGVPPRVQGASARYCPAKSRERQEPQNADFKWWLQSSPSKSMPS